MGIQGIQGIQGDKQSITITWRIYLFGVSVTWKNREIKIHVYAKRQTWLCTTWPSFSPYFPFTVYCFYTKISSFMPALSIRIALDCFYLLIFYSEKFSTDVCRLPYAVNVNLNLSNNPWCEPGAPGLRARPGLFRNAQQKIIQSSKTLHVLVATEKCPAKVTSSSSLCLLFSTCLISI